MLKRFLLAALFLGTLSGNALAVDAGAAERPSISEPQVTASSAQDHYPASKAIDGDDNGDRMMRIAGTLIASTAVVSTCR